MLPPSIFSPHLVSTVLSPFEAFGMLAPLLGIPPPHLKRHLNYLQIQAQNVLILFRKNSWPLTILPVRYWFGIFLLILVLKSFYVALHHIAV